MALTSKLPNSGTSIFAVMSGLARETGAINLSQGFPNFDCPEELKQLVYHYMQKGHNQYAPMPGIPLLRERLMEKYHSLYGCGLDPVEEITITAGATQAIFTSIMAFVHPGDEVIIFEPAYDSYVPAIRLCGATPVAYKMAPPKYNIDWEEVRRLITPKTRLMIINTPHNPSGQVLTEEDLGQLRTIARANDLLFIFDEVYEHLIYDDIPHYSALRYSDLYSKSIVIYSFGKTYHNTGWKMGYAIAPPKLTKEIRKVHQFNVFSVNTPTQFALADYLLNEDWYRDLPSFYQEKRDAFVDILSHTRFTPIPCQGTYFQLASYAAISDEGDLAFAERITREFGVACIPVSAFYMDKSDYKVVRFCFAKTRDVLEAAGERLSLI